jgi:putative transposase
VLTEHGIQIAPRTYRKARRRPPSARDVTDAYLENALRELRGTPEQMYGRRKMTLCVPKTSSMQVKRHSDTHG